MFLQKSAQAIENKELGLKKERQESLRARNLLKHQHLGLELCDTVAVDSGKGDADFVEVRQRKELAGLAGTS